jgi:hypothetical protein
MYDWGSSVAALQVWSKRNIASKRINLHAHIRLKMVFVEELVGKNPVPGSFGEQNHRHAGQILNA